MTHDPLRRRQLTAELDSRACTVPVTLSCCPKGPGVTLLGGEAQHRPGGDTGASCSLLSSICFALFSLPEGKYLLSKRLKARVIHLCSGSNQNTKSAVKSLSVTVIIITAELLLKGAEGRPLLTQLL